MLLSLEHVSKRFGELTALEDISLEVAPGEIVAVLGANGAGKSTLLRLLGAILVPSSGCIRIDGERLGRERLDLRKRLAFLPEFAPVFPGWTPLQQIAMTVRLYGAETEDTPRRIVELLRDFDLLAAAESSLWTLSRGQAYKAALVGLLAVNPELWVLDEPFATGLDARAVTAFRRQASHAAKRGRIIVYSTQLIEVVEPLATRVAVVSRGNLTAWESIENLRAKGAPLIHSLAALLDQAPEVSP
jgi:ABC-type multidrug transport system ATPase subunit